MAVGFGVVFQNATFINWQYNAFNMRSTMPSGVTLTADGNMSSNADIYADTTDPLRYGENNTKITFTVGAPRGLKYSENRDFLQHIYDPDKTKEPFKVAFDGADWATASNANVQAKITSGELVTLNNYPVLTPFNGDLEQANCWSPVNIGGSGLGDGNIEFSVGWAKTSQKPFGKIRLDETAFPQLNDGDVLVAAGSWMQQPCRYLNNGYLVAPAPGNDELILNQEQYGHVPYQVVYDLVIRGTHGGARYIEDTSGQLNNNEFFISRSSTPVGTNSSLPMGEPGSAPDRNSTLLGRNCYFTFIPKSIPEYTILPHDLIEFNGDFIFQETGGRGL
jgi:hypothetical protein